MESKRVQGVTNSLGLVAKFVVTRPLLLEMGEVSLICDIVSAQKC